jgi:DNA-binding HxlR family transcriptional regulator
MSRRSYQQSCPLARALDAVGERWTLLVIRELLLGPLRYGEIHERLPRMGTNLLADRLTHLERLGLVERIGPAGGHRWSLTASGRALEPALLAMIRWAMHTRLPSRPADAGRPEWDLVAMTALYRPRRGSDIEGQFGLVLNGLPATLTVAAGNLGTRVGPAQEPDAVIEMDSATGWRLASRTLTQAEALREGRLAIRGDQGRAARLLDCFRAD